MYVFCVQGSMGEAMSRRIRGVFNAANFWAIVLYNVLSLNSLEFAKTVGRRLIFKGTKQSQHCFILSTLQRSHTVPFCLSLSWPSTNIWSHACFADKSFSPFFLSSVPIRISAVNAVCAVCHLLWCAAGEGERAAASPARGTRACDARGWCQGEGRIVRQEEKTRVFQASRCYRALYDSILGSDNSDRTRWDARQHLCCSLTGILAFAARRKMIF